MKKKLSLIILLAGSVILTPKVHAQDDGAPAQVSACLNDVFYVFHFPNLKVNGAKFSGTGTMDDPGNGVSWNVTISGRAYKNVTITVRNPLADNCASGFTDSFQYSGTAPTPAAGLFYGTNFYFDGSGTWVSWCGGSIAFTGTWKAYDCSHKVVGPVAKGEQPARSGTIRSFLKVVPNPAVNSANITYTVTKAGRVSITVYNQMNQAVKVLVNDFKTAGTYTIAWDARASNAVGGIYRVVAVANNKTYSANVQIIR